MKSASNILKNHLAGLSYAVSRTGVGNWTRAGVPRRASYLSVATWLYMPAAAANLDQRIVEVNWVNDGWLLWYPGAVTGPTRMNWVTAKGGVQVGFSSLAGAFSIDNWHRVVGTYDNNRAKLYIDGVFIGQSGINAGCASDVTNDVKQIAGAAGALQKWKDMMIWSRDLSAAEILADYQGRYTVDGLTAWWPGDDGTGTTVTDLSGFGNNLTLSGAYAWEAFDPFPHSARQFSMADLYTFTLVDGTIVRYTTFDRSIKSGGNTFLAGDVQLKRSSTSVKLGVAVDELTLDACAAPTHLLQGVAWLHAARTGALDGATVKLERAFLVPGTTMVVGTVQMFSGRVADIDPITGTMATIKVASELELLNVNLPRNMYQPGCLHTLYDGGCSVIRNNHKAVLAAAVGSTASAVRTNAAQATGYFDLGTIKFTSGALAGISRTVKSYDATNGQFTLINPLPVVPVNGDALEATPGCDKQQATCGVTTAKTFTVNAGTDVFTSVAHALANGAAVKVASSGGTLAAPLAPATQYFVRDAAADTFKLAATLTGAAIDITTAGTGTQQVVEAGKFANKLNFRGYPYLPPAETAF